MNRETAKQLIQVLAGAVKGLQLYPLEHPAIGRQVENLHHHLSATLERGRSLRLGVLDGALFMEEYLFPDLPAGDETASLLKSLALEGVEFRAGMTGKDLLVLAGMLHRREKKGPDFAQALQESGVQKIIPLLAEEEEEESPREIYGRALSVMEDIFQDVRMGKIPSSTEAKKVVRSMVQTTLSSPHSLFALSMLKDYDNYTFTHSVNVSVIALSVGRACDLSSAQLRVLGLGALFHDLGKLKVAHGIINKPGRLTEDEFEEIKKHPRSGADLVLQMEGIAPEVVDIVLGHHMRFDRQGYPADAQGHDISPMADLVAIADSYDAMTTLRSYQRPMTPRLAIERLLELSGTRLHPQFLKRFVSSLGTYPVGSLVRLSSGEIGLVVATDIEDPDRLQLKVLFDAQGTCLSDPPRIELSGRATERIVAEVDPSSKGIEVTKFFDV